MKFRVEFDENYYFMDKFVHKVDENFFEKSSRSRYSDLDREIIMKLSAGQMIRLDDGHQAIFRIE